MHTLLRALILIVAGLCMPWVLHGQQGACFEVINRSTGEVIADSSETEASGCAPLKVKAKDCTPPGATYQWFFEEGQSFNPPDSNEYTYDEPGTYTLTQEATISGEFRDTSKTIHVLPVPEPSFTLSICQSRSIHVNIEDNTYDEYVVDYGDGEQDTLPPGGEAIHQYPSESAYTVTVTGLYQPEGCGSSKARDIPVVNQFPQPTIRELEVLNHSGTEGRIKLTFNADSILNYRILQTSHPSGNTTAIKTVPGQEDTIQTTIRNLDTENTTYCYQVEAFDECGNDTLSSQVCGIQLNATSNDRYNQLQWNSYPGAGLQEYVIYRNGSEMARTGNTAYRDSMVTCGRQYCYYVEGRVEATNTQGNPVIPSLSNDSCVTGQSNERPDTIAALVSSGSNGNVRLRWQRPEHTVKTYILERKTGGSFQQIATIGPEKTQYTDRNVSINRSPCYRLSYRDSCDKKAAWSPQGCPVNLNLTEINSVTLQLDWTAFRGYADTVSHYLLKKIDPEGNVYETINTGKSRTYTDKLPDSMGQKLRYQVEAVPAGSSFARGQSNQVSYQQNVTVYFPDAFTPNGDGLNDTFFPKGRFIKDITLYIYNRWGELIHVVRNKRKGWDGRLKDGTKASPGVYTYKAEITDQTGVTFSQKGSFMLIRK